MCVGVFLDEIIHSHVTSEGKGRELGGHGSQAQAFPLLLLPHVTVEPTGGRRAAPPLVLTAFD